MSSDRLMVDRLKIKMEDGVSTLKCFFSLEEESRKKFQMERIFIFVLNFETCFNRK